MRDIEAPRQLPVAKHSILNSWEEVNIKNKVLDDMNSSFIPFPMPCHLYDAAKLQ
jgi:hypothetical protein